ncbi:hypothetical protein CISIN_1g035999mg [Citrus sinensis]|uniref:Uncharacterized protein n=1 Tax=Citrus sinensis TaxID=2711 RepID=A0A067GL22_CITSI|nr:hypothetical protein CISIN_1g035999mg [Citrus sinensis]
MIYSDQSTLIYNTQSVFFSYVGITFMTHNFGDSMAAAKLPKPAFISIMLRYLPESRILLILLYEFTCFFHDLLSSW